MMTHHCVSAFNHHRNSMVASFTYILHPRYITHLRLFIELIFALITRATCDCSLSNCYCTSAFNLHPNSMVASLTYILHPGNIALNTMQTSTVCSLV